jgi:hypothetical protein
MNNSFIILLTKIQVAAGAVSSKARFPSMEGRKKQTLKFAKSQVPANPSPAGYLLFRQGQVS